MKLYGYEVNTCNYKNFKTEQLKKDQQKHGYKELTTMIADILEKHYDHD